MSQNHLSEGRTVPPYSLSVSRHVRILIVHLLLRNGLPAVQDSQVGIHNRAPTTFPVCVFVCPVLFNAPAFLIPRIVLHNLPNGSRTGVETPGFPNPRLHLIRTGERIGVDDVVCPRAVEKVWPVLQPFHPPLSRVNLNSTMPMVHRGCWKDI